MRHLFCQKRRLLPSATNRQNFPLSIKLNSWPNKEKHPPLLCQQRKDRGPPCEKRKPTRKRNKGGNFLKRAPFFGRAKREKSAPCPSSREGLADKVSNRKKIERKIKKSPNPPMNLKSRGGTPSRVRLCERRKLPKGNPPEVHRMLDEIVSLGIPLPPEKVPPP